MKECPAQIRLNPLASRSFFQLTAISESAYTKSVEIQFSRHAKNKMRLYKLTPEDVKEAINSGEKLNREDKWESRHGKLRVIWLTVGSYALVVTVIRTR
jgi:flavoprotein